MAVDLPHPPRPGVLTIVVPPGISPQADQVALLVFPPKLLDVEPVFDVHTMPVPVFVPVEHGFCDPPSAPAHCTCTEPGPWRAEICTSCGKPSAPAGETLGESVAYCGHCDGTGHVEGRGTCRACKGSGVLPIDKPTAKAEKGE